MRKLLLLLLSFVSTVPAAPLQYYHCIDEEGNAYFGETPPTQCKGEIKTIVVDETPPPAGEDYYSIKNQAKRLEAQRATEEERRKREQTEALQKKLLEQQLANEKALAEKQKTEENSSDRNVILYPGPLTRPHRLNPRPKPVKPEKDKPEEPPRAYRQ